MKGADQRQTHLAQTKHVKVSEIVGGFRSPQVGDHLIHQAALLSIKVLVGGIGPHNFGHTLGEVRVSIAVRRGVGAAQGSQERLEKELEIPVAGVDARGKGPEYKRGFQGSS